ncbi:DUF1064 domain-containing protein [Sulfitobacter faviae]|uniref:DUF1064 domain-containing protein n=1 Tax=Sulfitobacter faviae TaxID=1775881 RepID=UPI002306F254|nr:DUF1064 domain-containing protein [Sulfitobacter faviae]WCE67955.1 DUF1064 domain-containing protein [Sulfitobacter faviae]
MTNRITAAEFLSKRSTTGGAKKGRVRGTKAMVVDGIKFHSKREGNRYAVLRQLECAGIIENLRLQVPYELQGADGPILTPTGRNMIYKADFVYFDKRINAEVVEDSKGWATDVFKIKKAILAAQGVLVVES